MYSFKINRKKYNTNNSIIDGKTILATANLTPVEDFELLKKVNEKGFEPIQLDEKVDLREPGIEGFFAKRYKVPTIYVDDEPVEIEEFDMTPNQILSKVGKRPENHYLKQIRGHKEISYKKSEDREHKIQIKNGLRFTTCKLEATPVS